jgi:disulfide bond formation protein DsbB
VLAPPLSEGALRLKQARLLALLIPSGLLGGALFSQYVGGLYPCEMCYWQRWPHAGAILLAIGAYLTASNRQRSRMLVMVAALAVAISGAIGVFHAGVEIGWWEGITQCTATGATSLQDIMNVPLVRCDQVQWDFLGISMAGWNAIISLAGALAIIALARRGV